MKHIGNTIKRYIEDNRLSKAQVASEVGITPTYLAKIFNKGSLDCALLDRFCQVLKLRSNYFFDDDADYESNIIGNVSTEALVGGNVEINQGGLAAMKVLLAEKERLIQILLKAKGFTE